MGLRGWTTAPGLRTARTLSGAAVEKLGQSVQAGTSYAARGKSALSSDAEGPLAVNRRPWPQIEGLWVKSRQIPVPAVAVRRDGRVYGKHLV